MFLVFLFFGSKQKELTIMGEINLTYLILNHLKYGNRSPFYSSFRGFSRRSTKAIFSSSVPFAAPSLRFLLVTPRETREAFFSSSFHSLPPFPPHNNEREERCLLEFPSWNYLNVVGNPFAPCSVSNRPCPRSYAALLLLPLSSSPPPPIAFVAPRSDPSPRPPTEWRMQGGPRESETMEIPRILLLRRLPTQVWTTRRGSLRWRSSVGGGDWSSNSGCSLLCLGCAWRRGACSRCSSAARSDSYVLVTAL